MYRSVSFGLLAVALLTLSACTLKGTTEQITDTTQNTAVSTSGRSWFTNDGLVRQGEHVNAFAALNYDNLTHDMAFGGGEYLASLGTLLGVPDDQRAAFFQLAQRHYTTFAQSDDVTPVNLMAGLDRSLAKHGIVTAATTK
ncbi:MAG: DUF3015 family protein [Acidimicrobiia bacterium]